MIRFDFLERLGVSVAAMSDISDGDCKQRPVRDAFCAKCGVSSHDLVHAHQVHGTRIAEVTPEDRGRGGREGLCAFDECDGLVTRFRGLPIAVSVADCVPVFLYDPVCKAGAIVHAGREGTRLAISAAAVTSLVEKYGSSVENLHCVIGPSAGPCCYEVSQDMAADWLTQGLPAQGRRLDLWKANAQQLTQAGVPEKHIEIAGLCTVCTGRFFSYRQGGGSSRNMAMLVL